MTSVAGIAQRVSKSLQRARRSVLSGLAAPTTRSHLEALARFDHPLAAKLARALGRIRSGDYEDAQGWIERIERERAKMEASREPLGAFAALGPFDQGMTVADASRASRRFPGVMTLHRLVADLAPQRVLELGTNLGVSSAYMGAALQDLGAGTIVTLEASPARQAVARKLHETLGLTRVQYRLGLFDDTLDGALDAPVDFAFVDGHHQAGPTLDYFDRIWRHSTEGALFLFDDVRWTFDMERAWKTLCADPRLRIVVDLCGVGLGVGTRDPSAKGRHVTPILAV